MINEPTPIQENPELKLNDVLALKELIAVIVDYYCFKNNDFLDIEEDDEENYGQSFSENKDESNNIIPTDMHTLIEETFKSQLTKFKK